MVGVTGGKGRFMSIQGTFGSFANVYLSFYCAIHMSIFFASSFCVQELIKLVLYHSHVQYLCHSFADKLITQEVIRSV